MDLRYLYTIKKVVETGNYQKAAMALNYAPSTVTAQIKQLEKELQVKIFCRKGNKMELTHAGQAIYPTIEEILLSTDKLFQICENENCSNGSLSLVLPESIMSYLIQPILKMYREKEPTIQLSLQVLNCYDIYKQMCAGTIDIAIHYDVGKYSSGFQVLPLGTFPVSIVASPNLYESDFVTPNQVKNVCLIQDDTNALPLKLFRRYLHQKNIILKPDIELRSIETVKQSVISNLGIAVLPKFTVEKELAAGLLQEICLDNDLEKIKAICVYQKDHHQTPATKLFIRILEAWFT